MLNVFWAFLLALFASCSTKQSEPEFLEGCPHIQLTGKVEFSTVPGAPNYEDIDSGDFPSEKWFIIPNEASRQYLLSSGVFEKIPENYRPVLEDWKDHIGSIQVAATGELEKEFVNGQDRELTLEGWLGSWDTHCSSLFFFEVDKIKN